MTAPKVDIDQDLAPAERLALSHTIFKMRNKEEPSAAAMTVCVLALARLTGMFPRWSGSLGPAHDAECLTIEAAMFDD